MKSSISPTAYALLSQIALTGEFPADAVPRLIPHAAYAAKIVSALKKDKLIRAYRRDQLCTLRLSAVGRAFLLADAPDRFGPLLYEIDPYKTELHHRSRRCQMAQLALTMRSAGVAIFPDEKPPLSALSLQTLRLPAYYSSLEIKGMGIEGTKIKNARFCGVLLTENKCLLCYHAGDGSLRWTRQSELKSRALLTHLFCRQLLPGRYTVGRFWTHPGRRFLPLPPNLRKPVEESEMVDESVTVTAPPGAYILDTDHKQNEFGCYDYIVYLLPERRARKE